VVTNLVDNALRHARGAVRVALTVEDGQAVISVADDGPGIPPADREQIWDRFVRLDHDRARAGGGSGLGLALVRELVQAHGGTASAADPATGPGALFVVRLPLCAGHDRSTAAADPVAEPDPPFAAAAGPDARRHLL
jgi:signal transduction histidine kinase